MSTPQKKNENQSQDDGYQNVSDQKMSVDTQDLENLQMVYDDDKYIQNNQNENQIQMAITILKQAIPGMFCMVTLFLQEVLNLIFIGHLDDPALLAGVGMGNTILSVFGISLFLGLNGALETLVSQAYGSKNLKLCGIYLNRGRFVLLVLNIPVIFILFQAEKILVMIGQNAMVAAYAQTYIIAYIPGLILNGLNDSQRRFLNMIELTKIPLICQLFGISIHILLSFLFVWQWDLGIAGTGYASSISNLSVYLSLLIYTSHITEIQEAVQLPNARTFQGLHEYLSLGIPSAMMLCLEWWAFEAMVVLSGYIGVNEQACMVIMLNILGLLFFLALGLQQAASSNIGHEIGRQNIEKAKLYMNITNKVAALFIGSAVLSFYIFHTKIIKVFTNILSVQEAFSSVIGLAVMASLPDMWQGYLQGIIKALGIQGKVIYLNFIAYWIINIPLCYNLIFRYHFGFSGIWIAMNCCQYFLACAFQIMILNANWNESSEQSIQRQKTELSKLNQIDPSNKTTNSKELISKIYEEQDSNNEEYDCNKMSSITN